LNFLAHSVLAFDDDALLVGQIAGDFVRGPDLSAYPSRIATGIRLHRRIDAFTDGHLRVADARRLFEPPLRRYAGIIVDIVFDHWLARHWPSPGGRDLASHARWVDTTLATQRGFLGDDVLRFASYLATERVLERNEDIDAVSETLLRVSRRSPRLSPMATAAPLAADFASALEAPFLELWPELSSMARTWLATQDGFVR